MKPLRDYLIGIRKEIVHDRSCTLSGGCEYCMVRIYICGCERRLNFFRRQWFYFRMRGKPYMLRTATWCGHTPIADEIIRQRKERN